ncbi:hypothetical protein [Diplocloster hominis]|uniref:hypothetical protein n=1 Tax=Diplocloster hominis TaxID=3079010 RepID=UPI0031B9EEB1
MNREWDREAWLKKEWIREQQPYRTDPDKKEKALAGIREEVKGQVLRYQPGLPEIIAGQLQYLSAGYWILQGILLAVMLSVMYWMNRNVEDAMTYIAAGSAFAAFAGVIGVQELGRSMAYHMAELEQTFYLNMKQILALRMILFGGMDLLFLTALALVTHQGTEYGIGVMCIYLLVPFAASNIVYFATLTLAKNRRARYIQTGAAMLAVLFSMMPAMTQEAYRTAAVPVWLGILLIMLAVLGIQIRILLQKAVKGELLCWN